MDRGKSQILPPVIPLSETEGLLTVCILNRSRTQEDGGFFKAQERSERRMVHEISLNLKSLTPPVISVMAIPGHELVQLLRVKYSCPSGAANV
jgi:hypothetical protein